MEIFLALDWEFFSVNFRVTELSRNGLWTEKKKYVLVLEICKWWTNWNQCKDENLLKKSWTFPYCYVVHIELNSEKFNPQKRNFNMGTSQSTWKVTSKVSKRRQSGAAKNGSLTRGQKFKSDSNLLDEVRTKNVQTNPLYRHQDIFDNDLFFEEILAKIEQEAAKLSNSDKHSESPKGFDSFMLYWLVSSLLEVLHLIHAIEAKYANVVDAVRSELLPRSEIVIFCLIMWSFYYRFWRPVFYCFDFHSIANAICVVHVIANKKICQKKFLTAYEERVRVCTWCEGCKKTYLSIILVTNCW